MKHHLFFILLTSGLLGSLAACGGSPSVSEALDNAITAGCQKAFDCMSSFPSGQGITFEQAFGASESECVSTNESAAADNKAKLVASVDAGRIIYNGDDAQDCIDAETSATCAQFWGADPYTPPASCDTAFQGTVADGGACTIDEDCASANSSCDSATMTCTPG